MILTEIPRTGFTLGSLMTLNITLGQTTGKNKGINGTSGLSSMTRFDTGLGIVPDYMHGVLMAVTMTILNILDMTMHNVESGCSTCEEPGRTLKQGKGHSRFYPYRETRDRFPLRDSGDIKYNHGPKTTTGKENQRNQGNK